MGSTYKDLGEPKLWRNDRFFLAMDHTVDPRNVHQPFQQRLVTAARDFAEKVTQRPPSSRLLSRS